MLWDNTQHSRNADGKPYTHEVNDGTQRYRCVMTGAPLRTVAEAFTQGYDHGPGEGDAVAEVTHLRSGKTARFAFNRHGTFEWNTTQEFLS